MVEDRIPCKRRVLINETNLEEKFVVSRSLSDQFRRGGLRNKDCTNVVDRQNEIKSYRAR
jgi:hypothetical protein